MASAAFLCNFSENECNKFNCWDFKLSNNVNTVHVAAVLRKLRQQEKVFKYLCTPPKRDLLSWRRQVGGGEAWRGGCSPPAVKKIWKSFQKRMTIQYFRPSDWCSNTFGGKCTWWFSQPWCLGGGWKQYELMSRVLWQGLLELTVTVILKVLVGTPNKKYESPWHQSRSQGQNIKEEPRFLNAKVR